MKKALQTALILCAASTLTGVAQTPDLFNPYKTTDLRLPSVPLITSDPYFSIWSPFDRLTDGSPRHWTDEEKPLEGIVRVDGKNYRFMGVKNTVFETVVPMADECAWEAAMTRETPAKGWEKPGFDDSKWKRAKAAFGSPNLSNVRTPWDQQHSDLYVRRTVDLTPEDIAGDLFMVYSHDDVFTLFVNGAIVAKTPETWKEGVKLQFTDDMKKLLRPGKNVIAAHCHNTTGGAYTDFGIYRNTSVDDGTTMTASQKSVTVMPTSTYYTFEAGPVELDVVFTAPALIDNYDLLSSPVNYISYQVRSTDGREHDVQLLLTASPQIAQNKTSQPTRSTVENHGGVKYLKTGTIEQPILAKTGDHICIDWGYLYLPAINGQVSLNSDEAIKTAFLKTGKLPESKQEERNMPKSSQAATVT